MKRLKQIVLGLGMAAAIAAAPVPVYAMEDGAYTVGRTTSYANPETGQTVDGGTNIALGDSMCESIVEDSALVEQSQGKTYVTLGIGLMSNVSDVCRYRKQTELIEMWKLHRPEVVKEMEIRAITIGLRWIRQIIISVQSCM